MGRLDALKCRSSNVIKSMNQQCWRLRESKRRYSLLSEVQYSRPRRMCVCVCYELVVASPFRYFKTSPEIIRLAVMM